MNKKNTAKYIIIGAGLSGLTSAYFLNKQDETSFVDFGATWFQNHHKNVLDLIDELEIDKFHQYNKGKSVLVYNSMAPAHYFENDPNAPSAYRISGGSSAIINKLSLKINNKIITETTVNEIKETKNGVTVITNTGEYFAKKIIVTIPPRLATELTYLPNLSPTIIDAMKKTHTWMSNAIKVGLTFSKPFWRDKGLSGTIIGQVGAVTELYDHSSSNNESFSLMGFVNEGLRDVSSKERKEIILTHLQKYLGEEVLDYLTYEEKDWSKDIHTSYKQIKSIYMSPRYGNPIFGDFHLNGKLLFSGAETSPVYGGYMDGAIYSGINVVEKLLE